MQFHHSTPPQNVRIRRIPTIRLQTMKHPRRNCMRNCEGGGAKPPRKVARNSIEQSFNKVRKRCNSNDLNSRFEIVAGELRAKLGMASAMPQARAEHDTRSCGGAWPRCPWAAVGHGRGARGRRWGMAAVPVGGGGAWPGFEATRRATSATRRHWCGGHRRDPWAWLRGPWAAAEPGQASHSDLAPQVWRAPEGSAAVPVGGGGAWRG